MGLFKDMKAGVLAQEAQKAAADGMPIFTPKLNAPASASGMTGNIADWAMMIASVEEAGWRLDHWAVGNDAKGKPEAYPLFRRA